MVAGVPLLAFLALPIFAIAWRALGAGVAATDEFNQAVRLSFETSLASIVAIVILGTPLAFALARFRFPFCRLVGVMVDLPVVLPPAAAGIGLLLAFGRHGIVATSFAFTTTAVIMAQIFVASPFYIRAATIAFKGLNRDLEESAALDGARPLDIFGRVTLPICSKSLLSGAITSWARALGEFGATILFAGNLVGRTQTMPLAIYLGFESDLDLATKIAGILLAIASGAILTVRWLTDRSGE